MNLKKFLALYKINPFGFISLQHRLNSTYNLGQNMLRQIVNSYRNQPKFISQKLSQSHIFMLKEPKTLHLPL